MNKVEAPYPLLPLDYPDPDVIRVDDTYYLVSTTMHFMPGCEILKSYDLVNWEHACYVYDRLDSTPAQCLEGDLNIYGKGMWAASLRHHKGSFYVVFAANDTRKTYLYTTSDLSKPWKKQFIEGFYHDASLFFDDDERIYLVYGNTQIWLTELKSDLTAPKDGGIHKVIVSEEDNPNLGYEGSHFYKINNQYYLFLIHSLPTEWKRVQVCYTATSLDDPFVGKEVLNDDRGYFNQGIAQGGIVDSTVGDWYAVLFQDMGAVGRLPVLVPVSWEEEFPVFGKGNKVPKRIEVLANKPEYKYAPLYGSDDFRLSAGTPYGLKSFWQFNHEPNIDGFSINPEKGYYEIINQKTSKEMTQSQNMLTQRMTYPTCAAEVTIDASKLKNGDTAGFAVLQYRYAFIGIKRENDQYRLILTSYSGKSDKGKVKQSEKNATVLIELPLDRTTITFKIEVDFRDLSDKVQFYYKDMNEYIQLGPDIKLFFDLEHFVGNRFALFSMATESIEGRARFFNFNYFK
ncbi:glycoside hydrolase family 43 protein [Alkalibacterium sp. MB6]|uniref:glycoside hydrolase family 43 protein n=1 Tax=Alkalibacterium sp. MB6 TaxID=2081965 RepID=UPI001379472C|nr:glycoside hydrolase 43 family protein [Alkalibacterium sp. MB6]